MKIIYGKKIQMGEAYIGDIRAGVTKIALHPMTVSQLKSVEKEGYLAMQVGFGAPKKHTKRTVGKNREISYVEGMAVGTVIAPKDVVSVGSICNIQGTSKGKGFAGVVKRWNFAGGPRTHGQSDRLRAPGSIGQGTTPGRVHKGKKMPGRMGSDTVTVKKSVIVSFNEADNTIWVTGGVPGSRHSLVRLTVMDQKDLGVISYVTGGNPIKIVEPIIEVASDKAQIDPAVAGTQSDKAQIDPAVAETQSDSDQTNPELVEGSKE
jgi:large subunit ribosomal protein L3